MGERRGEYRLGVKASGKRDDAREDQWASVRRRGLNGVRRRVIEKSSHVSPADRTRHKPKALTDGICYEMTAISMFHRSNQAYLLAVRAPDRYEMRGKNGESRWPSCPRP
jgi:hypothetical protein